MIAILVLKNPEDLASVRIPYVLLSIMADRRYSVGGSSMSVEFLFSACGIGVQQNSINVIQINAY